MNGLKRYKTDSSFRFNAEKVYLTYSQTKEKMDEDWLYKQISLKADIHQFIISQEEHEDGGKHLHAYFEFLEKLDTRNPKFFDVDYYNKSYHPNIQKPKTRNLLWLYIAKSGRYKTNIPEIRPKWMVIVEDVIDYETMMEKVMEEIGTLRTNAGYRHFRELWSLKNNPSETQKRYLEQKSGTKRKQGEKSPYQKLKERYLE